MANTTSIITLYRRAKLCKVTSGAETTIPPITHVAFGDGGADASGSPLDLPADRAGLQNEIARYPIISVAYPAPTTARYTVTIPRDELDGARISEAALVDSSGAACAIKNMYVKQKDTGVAFTFEFDDEF
jgi:hypothetical protein